MCGGVCVLVVVAIDMQMLTRHFLSRTQVGTAKGQGVDEVGHDSNDESRVLVRIDPQYFRPTEVELLIGNAAKAKAKLGWEPTIQMEELCKEMVGADIKLVEKGDLTS